VCIALCTIVAHNIAQNRPDSFPPYPPDNHHCSDDVYLREGHQTYTARKPQKTPTDSHEMDPAAHAVCSERIPLACTQGVSAVLSAFFVPVTLTFDHDIQTRASFLYNAPNRQVSSSYVYSFGSYRVDKQTNKQTLLKTSTSLCYATPVGKPRWNWLLTCKTATKMVMVVVGW